MIKTGSKQVDSLIDQYLNSSYDEIKTVYDNLDSIANLSSNISDIQTVQANLADINNIVDNLAEILDARDATHESIASNLTALSTAAEPIGTLTKTYTWNEATETYDSVDNTTYSVIHYHNDVQNDANQVNLDKLAVAADLAATVLAANSAASNAALTAADVVSTNADVVQTASDVAQTNADVVTAGNSATTAINAANSASSDATATAADRVATNADVVATNADVVTTTDHLAQTTAHIAQMQAFEALAIDHTVRTSGDGSEGTVDIYTMWGDAAETTDLGTFNVYNGADGIDVDHISRTSGDGSQGTIDVYTVWADDIETMSLGTINVYQGVDGGGNMSTTTYDTTSSGVVDNAELVNGLTVETAVPSGAVFTDTQVSLTDSLTDTSTTVAASAAAVKALKDYIDGINTLLSSDDTDLDEIQELVDFIKVNKNTLDNLTISNIAGLQAALDAKSDTDTTYTVGDGGLTEINFTSADHSKLDNIEPNATADMTPTEILNAIKTVDGASSGLDADLVDGRSATTANNANTIVARDPNGDITTRYFRSEGPTTTSAADGIMVTVNGTNHARRQTFAQFATAIKNNIGVGDGALSAKNFTTALNTKLDGIEDNATGDQTPSELLAAIKTVDVGGTAGLNAGTMDGYTLTEGATGNTVVKRSSSGHITGNYIIGSYLNMSHPTDVGSPSTSYSGYKIPFVTTDGYIRKMTQARFATELGSIVGVGDGKLTEKNFTTGRANKVDDLNTDYLLQRSSTGGQLNSTHDLDDYNSVGDVGIYTWVGDTPANGPVNYATLIVTHDGGQAIQKVYGGAIDNQQRMFLRRRTNSTWDNWTEVYTDSNLNVGDGGLTQKNFTDTLKTKLDSVESGATADQTPAQLLSAIKTVDVNGTAGLNAGRLNSLANSTGNLPNTHVTRTADGDINVRLLRSEYAADLWAEGNFFLTQNAAGPTSDNYARPMSAGAVKTKLEDLGIDATKLNGLTYEKFDRILCTFMSPHTGDRVRITLPWSTNSSKMLKFTIEVYAGYVQHKYEVSGYLYATTNNWYLPTVIHLTSGSGAPDIEFGRANDGKAYVSVNRANYTGIVVRDLVIGFTGSVADHYVDGWTAAIDTTVGPNQVTPIITKVWTDKNDGNGSGLDADRLRGLLPSSSAGNNTIVQRSSVGYIYGNYINMIGSCANPGSGTFPASGAFLGTNGTDTFARSYSTNAVKNKLDIPVSNAKKFNLQCTLAAGANMTVTVVQSSSFVFRINNMIHQTDSGQISAQLFVDGSNLSPVFTVDSTEGITGPYTGVDLAVGTKITMVFTNNSSATNVSIGFDCVRV